jgi:hypothetical protein
MLKNVVEIKLWESKIPETMVKKLLPSSYQLDTSFSLNTFKKQEILID